MIIIGYQGIGKSTLSCRMSGYIDLESSNFFIDGKRQDDWYKIYGNIALDISKQGFNVFTPSHACLRKYLAENNINNEKICVCYPDASLKDAWIEKLKERYESNKSDKNFKAWKNAEDRFLENIEEIHNDAIKYDFIEIIIKDFNYNLSDLIKNTIGTYHLF